MVRVKRPARSVASQGVNKDTESSIYVTAVNSEVERHGKENTHASSHGINPDLEGRCSEHFLSTLDGYPVVEVNNNKDISKSCDVETNIITKNPNTTTFGRSEHKRKGSRVLVEHLKYYYRRRNGFFWSVKPLKTYRRRRSGYVSLGISPLPIQNSVEIKLEGTCHEEITTGDGESSNIAGNMVLGKDVLSQSHQHVNHSTAGNEILRSPVLPGSTCVLLSEEISAITTHPQIMELDPSQKSDIIVDKACDVLATGMNLNKPVNYINNDACSGITSDTELVESKQTYAEEASLVSSETVKQQIINQPVTADEKRLPEEAPSGSIKKKLLVLDINGLLADIVSVEHLSDEYRPDPNTMVAGKAVFKRPFCDEFLDFCFERFDVGVWSSRTRKNVDHVLNLLMGNKRQKLLFCWDQSHCRCSRYYTPENKDKPLFFKELNFLWETDHPWKRGNYDGTNTLLLDDSPYKALLNPPNTAIFPQTYQYSNEKDSALGPDGDLHTYLEGVFMAPNVQEYVRQNPFGQDPITENHPSWSFYHEVTYSTVVGSLRKPYQSWGKDVSQVNNTSVVAETIKECHGSIFHQHEKTIPGLLETTESNRQLMELAKVGGNFTSSLWSTPRGCKRDRGSSRSQSPRHGINGSQSHSLSPKKCRRNQSPAPSHGSDFGGDKARNYQTLPQGRSSREEACRFVHHQSHHEKAAPRECYNFIRGKCNWGASCRFLHSVPDKTDRLSSFHNSYYQDASLSLKKSDDRGEAQSSSFNEHGNYKALPEVCRNYSQGVTVGLESTSQFRDTSRYKTVRQVCRNYTQGRCHKGSDCWYLHQETGLPFGSGSTSQAGIFGRYKAMPEVCKSCTQGRCHKGPNCQYLHREQYLAGSGSTSQLSETSRYKSLPEVCMYYCQGRCHNGSNCRYLHREPDKSVGSGSTSKLGETSRFKVVPVPCRNYIQGRCHNGSDCRYLHQERGLTFGLGSTAQFGETTRYQAPPEVCRNYVQGRCHKGWNCQYLHQESSLTTGSVFTRQIGETSRFNALPGVCRNYTQGRCHKGSNCWYLHQEPGSCRILWQYKNLPYQNTSSSMLWNTKSIPRKCVEYTQGKCWRGVHCRYLHHESDQCGSSRFYRSHHQDTDVSSNLKIVGSFSDVEGILHETAVHDNTESRIDELIPESLGIDEKRNAMEALPKPIDSESFREASVVPADDAKDIKHIENVVPITTVGDSDLMILDAGNICHEISVLEDTELGTKELIPHFSVTEEKRDAAEALPNHPIDSNRSQKDSVVKDDDTKDEKVPENFVCTSVDNLGDSDRMIHDIDT